MRVVIRLTPEETRQRAAGTRPGVATCLGGAAANMNAAVSVDELVAQLAQDIWCAERAADVAGVDLEDDGGALLATLAGDPRGSTRGERRRDDVPNGPEDRHTLVWKDEGSYGPLTWRNATGEHTGNYSNSEERRGDGWVPEWYTLAQAKRIAKCIGVRLVEV